eukprot:gnl/TRDRNA2_/TRDRNA2_144584_c0_seq2.p1 gnl/TRDRNA2_/TRDRNA2_144584_c0~~gnl/TRDRNA2_/TRDRNA2_144584_c0_seq2.p1  ORF type:complete len:247 (-),score=22.28 gnl/TRDRNA2_/TRDRNA2_144584_c0_seq2:48-788(-)
MSTRCVVGRSFSPRWCDQRNPVRLFWPGTYGNYCGPTPEIALRIRSKDAPPLTCAAHGWKADAPVDRVDSACLRHDLRYCSCEQDLLKRRRATSAEDKLLSVLTALRASGRTESAMIQRGVDADYRSCIRRADQGLIADTMRVRGESQRKGCPADMPLKFPPWFCEPRSWTLGRMERVNFDLFLADLDSDVTDEGRSSLLALERQRRSTINSAVDAGIPLPKVASSKAVLALESNMRALLDGAADQ